jgi:hypothetical protein
MKIAERGGKNAKKRAVVAVAREALRVGNLFHLLAAPLEAAVTVHPADQEPDNTVRGQIPGKLLLEGV